MSDPRDLRVEPESGFADRLERELLARLSAETDATSRHRPVSVETTPEVSLMSPEPTRRPLLWIGAAALVVAAIVGVAVSAGGSDDDDPAVVDETPSSTVSNTTTTLAATTSTVASTTTTPATTTTTEEVDRSIDELPPVQPLDVLGIEPIAAVDRPSQLTTDGTFVWVSQDNGPVVGLDASGAPVMTLDVLNGEHAIRPVVAFDSLWVLTEVGNQLRRFDMATGTLQATLDLPGLVGGMDPHLAATDDAIYVDTQEDGFVLLTIDPESMTITNRAPLSSTTFAIVADADAERIYGFSLGSASIIDPATGRQDPQRIAAQSLAVISAFDSVWALTGMGASTLLRLDSETLEPLATIDVTPVGLAMIGSTATEDSLWVLTELAFMQVDPIENRVVARYGPPPAGGGTILATDTHLWFSDYANGTVSRIALPVSGD